MFFGRSADRKNKVEPIIGLVQFSTRVNVIFEAAKRDDPYADAHLLKIEAALRTADAFIHEQITVIDALLMDDGDISIKPSVAMNPQAHNVEFKTRFAHYALRLVSAYDRLVRGALAAQHTDRLSEGEWKRTVGVAATKLRHALACSGGFRASGATRNDFAANNQRAQAAVEKYGELAADVLRGSTRAERAPKIRHQSIVTAAQ
jgi:integrating conjugative element protein (TIGR03761 family)